MVPPKFQDFIQDRHTPLRGLSGVLINATVTVTDVCRSQATLFSQFPCSGDSRNLVTRRQKLSLRWAKCLKRANLQRLPNFEDLDLKVGSAAIPAFPAERT